MNRRHEASESIATCHKELLQLRKNLATPLQKVKIYSSRAVARKKERDAMSTNCKELRSSM